MAKKKRRAKNKDEWGTGIVEGIVAPESANNAVSGPSMIPLLTLGIPGSTIAAVFDWHVLGQRIAAWAKQSLQPNRPYSWAGS